MPFATERLFYLLDRPPELLRMFYTVGQASVQSRAYFVGTCGPQQVQVQPSTGQAKKVQSFQDIIIWSIGSELKPQSAHTCSNPNYLYLDVGDACPPKESILSSCYRVGTQVEYSISHQRSTRGFFLGMLQDGGWRQFEAVLCSWLFHDD